MTEKRKPEDTICPTIYAALVGIFAMNQSNQVGTLKLVVDIEQIKRMAACLGKDCQMFCVHFRGCGLRIR